MEPKRQGEIPPEVKKVTIQYESWIDLILDQNSPVSEASPLIEECLAETEGMAREKSSFIPEQGCIYMALVWG